LSSEMTFLIYAYTLNMTSVNLLLNFVAQPYFTQAIFKESNCLILIF
jgi:hypothetical protein